MPYFVIDDWSGGLDTRRLPLVSSPTVLLQLFNAHINPGGAIEKRKAFVEYAVATGTFGLAVVQDTITVFGSQAANPLPPDSPLAYQHLDTGLGDTIDHVEDWDLFDGLLYVVGRNTDGEYRHFYDGTFVPDGIGKHIETFEEKIYSVLDKNLHFSATGDPADWAGPGAGSINLSTRDAEAFALEGLEIYYDQLAVFSPRSVQFWSVDPDPLNNQQLQVLRSAGTNSGHSIRQYGGGDVLYLDSSGIRSLRARDSSNAASVSDIGSPIDDVLQRVRLNDLEGYTEALAATEVGSGRFWLRIGPRLFILSFFPGPDITAWSRYVPEVPIVDMVSYQLTIATRGEDDRIYLYGGEDCSCYDDCKVTAVMPFLSIESPATVKEFEALDIAGTNVWQIDYNLNPEDTTIIEENWSTAGVFNGQTYSMERMGLGVSGTHIAYRATCEAEGEALLANLTTHYQLGDAS